MNPFQPLGETARWRILYDLLKGCDVGDVLTYERMADNLGLNPEADRIKIRAALRRAAREFETENKHALVAVSGLGYRVVMPNEHVQLARVQQDRSNRALKRGHSKVVNVDLNGLSPEIRQLTEATMRALSMQMDFNRRLDVRQKRLESVVLATADRTERNEEEIATLKARLARLEHGEAGDDDGEAGVLAVAG